MYGLAGLEFVHQASRMRHEMADLFLLVTHGDLIGLPILPPYYSLRLLPHVIPEIDGWKRHLLAEKEAFEREDFHLHQM
ncbi:MAG: hypothetical protein HYY04_00405 [Chloroflexi bacterium]|nr:hypothetical protein [Chloroflexota bacterium]